MAKGLSTARLMCRSAVTCWRIERSCCRAIRLRRQDAYPSEKMGAGQGSGQGGGQEAGQGANKRSQRPSRRARVVKRQADRIDSGDIDAYVQLDWLEWDGGRLRLTDTGRDVCAHAILNLAQDDE